MAFNGANFAKLFPGANSDIPQVFGYHSGADALTLVDDAGYFNAKRDELNVGDTIHCYATAGTFMDYIVTAAPKSPLATNVTVSAKWDLVDA